MIQKGFQNRTQGMRGTQRAVRTQRTTFGGRQVGSQRLTVSGRKAGSQRLTVSGRQEGSQRVTVSGSQAETQRVAGQAYVQGTAAKKLAPKPVVEEEFRKEQVRRNAPRTGRQKQFRTLQGGLAEHKQLKRNTFIYLMCMVGALVLAALALYRYVDIQTSLESSVTQISTLEKQLAVMRKENDEAYSRANATVDLEEVKRVAIQELGMKYADEGQIIVYNDDGAADYVRQIAEIPEAGR